MSIFLEKEEELGIRRSRVEMACDIMVAISHGTERPTRMTQKANLSWGTLLMYLDVLIRNGFVARDTKEGTSFYRLTDRGIAVVQNYARLVDNLKLLNLEHLNSQSFAKSLKSSIVPKRQELLMKRMIEMLKGRGYRMLDTKVEGMSGIVHEFPIVAKDPSGISHGYALVENVREETIISLFAKQLDTDLRAHVLYTGQASAGATKCAQQYGIDLTFCG